MGLHLSEPRPRSPRLTVVATPLLTSRGVLKERTQAQEDAAVQKTARPRVLGTRPRAQRSPRTGPSRHWGARGRGARFCDSRWARTHGLVFPGLRVPSHSQAPGGGQAETPPGSPGSHGPLPHSFIYSIGPFSRCTFSSHLGRVQVQEQEREQPVESSLAACAAGPPARVPPGTLPGPPVCPAPPGQGAHALPSGSEAVPSWQ